MFDSYIDSVIRKVPDFPKQGILFYDITSLLLQPKAFNYCIDQLCSRIQSENTQYIAAIEARGFLFAAPAASRLNLPLVLLRKKGKLPGETIKKEFNLEYGTDEIHMHAGDISPSASVFLVDDLLATGGTAAAAASLIEDAGGIIKGVFAVIGLPFLNYAEALEKYTVFTLHDYQSE